jgi:hypothetical protein
VVTSIDLMFSVFSVGLVSQDLKKLLYVLNNQIREGGR